LNIIDVLASWQIEVVSYNQYALSTSLPTYIASNLISYDCQTLQREKIHVLNTEDVFKVMREVLLRENKIDRNKEHCWVISLSNSNQIMMIELVSLGSAKATIVEPIDIFSFAVQKQAVKIILVHNHPSGDLKPSAADILLTDQLQAIAEFLRIRFLDHFIISEKEYFSFRETGLLDKIKEESTYDLSFAKAKNLQKTIKGLEEKVKELNARLKAKT
jgi:DNA repair protein RadC